jgi:hypothetical protein
MNFFLFFISLVALLIAIAAIVLILTATPIGGGFVYPIVNAKGSEPALTITGNVIIYWPVSATNATLKIDASMLPIGNTFIFSNLSATAVTLSGATGTTITGNAVVAASYSTMFISDGKGSIYAAQSLAL